MGEVGLTSKPRTTALGGPCLAHSTTASTNLCSPSRTASTVPSGRFLTHPFTPLSSAVLAMLALKETPWTVPEILR